jgi:lipoprotein-releasing system permease protein
MIVVEKTRDIGILKSLGASGRGIMAIFLLYGLSLGVVGAGAGTALGVAFANNINEIKDFIERVQGEPVFDRSVYFFDKIPSIVEPMTVAWITAGAVAIAVLSSVLPARRAAGLHPVRALRFE